MQPSTIWRKVRLFLLPPLATLIVATIFLGITATAYARDHENRIYTGVGAGGVDLGKLPPAEAEKKLDARFSTVESQTIVLSDPASGREWAMTPGELGLSYDAQTTAETAYNVGRRGGPIARA